jgi:hypothetical protein
MPVAPAASCALGSGRTHTSNNEYPESPGVPARNGFNGFLRALPGDRACLPPSPADRSCLSPVGPTRLRKLDASVGRQDHTTSPYAATSFVSSPFDRSRAFRQPALPPRCAPNAAASTASHPASLTIRIRPSVGRDARVLDLIWVRWQQIFFGKSEKKTRQPCQETARRANHLSRSCCQHRLFSHKRKLRSANRDSGRRMG